MDKEIIRKVIQEEREKEKPGKVKVLAIFLLKTLTPALVSVATLLVFAQACVSSANGTFKTAVRKVVSEEIQKEMAPINGWMLAQFIFDLDTQFEKEDKRPWDLNVTDINRLIYTYDIIKEDGLNGPNLGAKIESLKIMKAKIQAGKYKKPKGAG